MTNKRMWALAGTSVAAAAALVACGGGGSDDNSGLGTLRLSLTDAPACGYDNAWVTVEKVRVHQSAGANDTDAGWSEVGAGRPTRVDLLTLTNGTLQPLGQTQLPAGTYTQMRLVLSPNTAANPLANAIKPTGGPETELTTPSGQQSGLKMNVNLEVPADKIADFAIDFDACKSFVKAGNSGKYLLKPVLSVLPILSDAGLRIVGFVDPSMVGAATAVSAQASGVPVRATVPNAAGQFVLYPVPVGNYDLVITAPGRVNAVMTGVPVITTAFTFVGSASAPVLTPAAAASAPAAAASGVITANTSTANTGGAVRALQSFSAGPTVEVGYAGADSVSGAYAFTLPTDAAARTAYLAGATTFSFASDPSTAGKYRLEASATGFAPKSSDITLTAAGLTTNFMFP